ncbi:NAD(P)/FAD-dependent oxidoreductase [Streptomyces sp. BBFR102]|uniref:NAD(P)/FAD-dependent oxidoreductase n=1 Tax=Streptomyces sp. BBFR102 TaxID=3448171 RepID=UPI003F531953
MSQPGSVLVVGASAAGLATAEALRRKGYRGPLTLLGEEPHPPYDRPPLSKQVLAGSWEPERARLRDPARLTALDVRLLLGEAAVRLDAGARTVVTSTGRTLTADALVLATGARPRTLPGQRGLRRTHVLRTLDDAVRLRGAVAGAARVVVAGNGVLGAEVAATVSRLGPEVTLAGAHEAPMAGVLGTRIAGHLARLHTRRGVHLVGGTRVTGLAQAGGAVTGVRTAAGQTLPADLVVVAVGCVPGTDWLAGSGLELADGVVCDSRCRAAEGVYAVGDVARVRIGDADGAPRLENRTNATEQAGAVAANILGQDVPYAPVPYFWTDQYDAKIQVHGWPSPDDDVTVAAGAEEDDRFVARYTRGGRTTAVLGWNMARQARLLRQELTGAKPRAGAVPVP